MLANLLLIPYIGLLCYLVYVLLGLMFNERD